MRNQLDTNKWNLVDFNDIENEADQAEEEARVKEAIALVPDLNWAGIDFDGAVGIKKSKLRQQIAELQAQLDLLEEIL